MEWTSAEIFQIIILIFSAGSVWNKINSLDKRFSRIEDHYEKQGEKIIRLEEKVKSLEQ